MRPRANGDSEYRPLNPCIICILADSSEKAQRRAFAATAQTAEEHGSAIKIRTCERIGYG
jgi:hypothetical protein